MKMEINSVENDYLSADTLFNFTPKLEFLISKIENRFKPRLVLEDYAPFGINLIKAIPMVCFCDIRLSDLSTHIKAYGDYGIGLSKEWGNKNGINPLIYISSENSVILDIFSNLITNKDENIKEYATKLFLYFKPYSGIQKERYRNFYNEREWRYIPDNNEIISFSKEDFDNEKKREDANNEIFNKNTLNYSLNDIKYIILRNETEKEKVAKTISQVFSVEKEVVYKNICFISKKIIDKDL